MRHGVFAKLLLLPLLLAACTHGEDAAQQHRYVTEYGLGPDKWATAWLLTRRAGAEATLNIVEPGAALVGGTPFDAPNASIRRIGDRAAFEVAARELAIDDPALRLLADIVHEIEVNFWASEGPREAQIVEDAYRNLQRRYGRDQVTPECYVGFFERVYRVLQDSQTRDLPLDADRVAMNCDELIQIAQTGDIIVPETPIADVLSAMAAGRRVVFVDVRESDEFAEGHIPDAVNIPLRDVGPHLAERFRGAEYVVSYCVKDFRGFEMAKALANVGVANSVIMRPYGIKGWVDLGLPVTGSRGMTEEQALADLQQCFEAGGQCLSERRRAKEGAAI